MRPVHGTLGLLALMLAGPLVAGPTGEKDPRFRLGVTAWFSAGRTTFAHDSSSGDPLLGNPTSKLHYSGLDSTVLELDAQVRLFWRLSLSARGGLGQISGGTLLDDDFVSAQGAQFYMTTVSGEHRYSRTLSDTGQDDLGYFEFELARQLLPKDVQRGQLKAFAAVRFWDESLLSTGYEQLECTAPNVLCPPVAPPVPGLVDTAVIGESSDWLVGLVGIEGRWRSKGRFELSGRLGFGLSDVEADDVHFLRTDLAQDPSFRWTGDGTAFDLELAGHYRVSPRFRIGLGYRIWEARADDGVLLQFSVDGSIGAAPLLEYETRRDGVLLYLEHRTAK